MALTSFHFAASNLAFLTSKLAALAPSSFGALIPAKLAAIPVVAGVAIGTAAGASFMASSGPVAKPAQEAAATNTPAAMPVSTTPTPAPLPPAAAARPCEEQTWPYIEPKCISGAAAQKRVRIVNAPRASDAVDPAAKAGLVTSDTVLRAPQNIDAIPLAKPAPVQPEKRREARKRERRAVSQTYQVPQEGRRGSEAVIVVRPLRLDAFR